MKHLFVSYEIAKQLKEKGFDEPCLARHLWDGTELNKEFKDKVSQPLYSPKTNTEFRETKQIGAPLYQQVTDWFRKKQIRIIENPNMDCWDVWIERPNGAPYVQLLTYLTLDKAIEEALKLI